MTDKKRTDAKVESTHRITAPLRRDVNRLGARLAKLESIIWGNRVMRIEKRLASLESVTKTVAKESIIWGNRTGPNPQKKASK